MKVSTRAVLWTLFHPRQSALRHGELLALIGELEHLRYKADLLGRCNRAMLIRADIYDAEVRVKDELLEALESVVEEAEVDGYQLVGDLPISQFRTIIAKAKGEA